MTTPEETREQLLRIYTTPGSRGALGGVEKLYRAARADGLRVTREQARAFLAGVDAYTLTKPRRYHFERNRVLTSDINDIHMADLADMQKLSRWNDSAKYLLVIIDVLRKWVWVAPVRSKGAEEMRGVFVEVYSEEANRPRALQTDKGTEFYNRSCRSLFRQLNIRHYSTENAEVKASVCERVIRTLKGLIYRYLLHNLTRRYIDALPDIVKNYNDTAHSSTGLAPSAVDDTNSDLAFQRLYPYLWRAERILGRKRKPMFRVGETVRISNQRNPFDKGYLQSWSSELYKIARVVDRTPLVYKVVDADGRELAGTFYRWELQAVKSTDVYRVEKIVGRRTLPDGRVQLRVKWQNFPTSANSWVLERDIVGPDHPPSTSSPRDKSPAHSPRPVELTPPPSPEL